MLQAAIDEAQQDVSGTVASETLQGKLYAWRDASRSTHSIDWTSPRSRKTMSINQKDAEGFIRLNALRLKIRAQRKKASS